ncbi:NAD(P)/FAD-dependent oxidoreductase, partial [Glaciimonas sp. Cout2]
SVAAVAPAAAGGFVLETATGSIAVSSVVIASGGLSIPKIGATDFAHQIARQFGLKVIEPRPALVPLSFALRDWEAFVPLA